jgi:hypothetical protein
MNEEAEQKNCPTKSLFVMADVTKKYDIVERYYGI